MEEIWKDIPGYEESYQVSNLGRVKSLAKNRGRGIGYCVDERIIKHSVNSRGYCNVVLCKNGKTQTFSMHRLVAENFIENPSMFTEVDHKDRNKQNNRVDNLRWVTRVDNNMNRKNGIPVICIETGKTFASSAEAGKKLGLQSTSISACCKNRKYHNTCGGYHWKYE